MDGRVRIFFKRLGAAVGTAIKPSVATALWVIKFTIPITFGVAVLRYLGVVGWISGLLSPLFSSIGLPGESALVFISSALSSLYSGVAVMATVGIDMRSAIILATMQLICHNLIIETAIQKRAGSPVLNIITLRIGISILAGFLLNRILPVRFEGTLFFAQGLAAVASWRDVFIDWALTLYPLAIKLFTLIVALNILQNILRRFRLLELIAWPLRPLMAVYGLPRSTSFLWIICNFVGITYGGAAIEDELKNGKATKREARLLNTHVAISHSMLEDTVIFVAMGLPILWVMLPRITISVAVVWLQRLLITVKEKNLSGMQHFLRLIHH